MSWGSCLSRLPVFDSLLYLQLGFRKRKSSGTVNTEKVYESGRHLVGPDTEFKPFPADAHFETFDKVTVFTSDKLQVRTSSDKMISIFKLKKSER